MSAEQVNDNEENGAQTAPEESDQEPAASTRKGTLIKAAIGGIVLVLLALAIVGIVWLVSGRSRCELTDLRPEYSEIGVKNYLTSDFEAIANFAGFLRYELEPNSTNPNPNRVFIPLEMEHLYVNHPTENVRLLSFAADCAEITLQVEKSGTNFYLENMRIELRLPNEGQRTCSIQLDNIHFPDGAHYYCERLHKLLCKSDTRYHDGTTNSSAQIRNLTVATLYIFRLEFEIDGNPNVIKEGRYSTTRDYCTRKADQID